LKRLSSSEAFWPAVKKTWHELFNDFAWPKYLKLCSVGALAEGIVVCYRYWVQNEFTSELHAPEFSAAWNSPYFPMVIWAVVSAIILLGFAYYTLVRLRFVLFHCLVYRTCEFKAGWNLHGRAALRMLLACSMGWLVVFMGIGVEVLVMATGGVTVLTARADDGKFDLGVFLLMYLIVFLTAIVLLTFTAISRIILHDFILPHVALEDITFSDAWAEFRKILAREREAFFSYLILRLLLSVIPWAILTAIATALGYLFIWIWSGSATGYDLLLGFTEDSRDYVRVVLDVFFVLSGLAASVLLNFVLGGPLAVLTRNFALLFYAGRYSKLGEAMSLAASKHILAEAHQSREPSV
jgi:hypothetical protein